MTVFLSLDNEYTTVFNRCFPDGSVVKNPPASAGDIGSILGSEISPGEGNGNPLQYSCLENPMDRGAWCEHPSVHTAVAVEAGPL